MIDGDNIVALIDRVKNGYGPDRDLDWDIAEALGAWTTPNRQRSEAYFVESWAQ